MAIKVKNSFIEENIEDENGKVIGKLRFNPKDSNIIEGFGKIMKLIKDFEKKNKQYGNLEKIDKEKISNIEDVESISEDLEKIVNKIDLETNIINEIFSILYSLFGKDTIDLFNGGAKDLDSIIPLLEYVMSTIEEQDKKINKYLKNNKDEDVME